MAVLRRDSLGPEVGSEIARMVAAEMAETPDAVHTQIQKRVEECLAVRWTVASLVSSSAHVLAMHSEVVTSRWYMRGVPWPGHFLSSGRLRPAVPFSMSGAHPTGCSMCTESHASLVARRMH